MAQIILGLDIGRYAIKGVRIARTLRGLRLIDAFEQKVARRGDEAAAGDPPGAPTGALPNEAQLDALRQLRAEGKIRAGEMTAVALPGHLVSTRELSLPFTDPKRLRQVVPFEIEGQLPFDLEEVVIDYQLLRQGPASEGRGEASSVDLRGGAATETASHLLVSAVPRAALRKYVAALQSVGIDPAWVGVDAVALQTFYQHFWGASPAVDHRKQPLREPLLREHLLIDLGASKTVLCAIRGGTLRWARTFPIGSDFFTEAIQKEFDLSWEEAERRKEEVDLTAQTPLAEAVQKAVGAWLMEIEKTLSLFALAEQPAGTEAPALLPFYICGGGGQMKGLQAAMAQALQMMPEGPDERLPPIAGLAAEQLATAPRLYAPALGLALPPQGTPINFRQGEFVFGKESIERRHRWVSIGLVFLLLVGLMGGDFYFRYRQKEARFEELKRDLRASFTQAFPQSKNVSNEVDQIRSAIGERRRTGEFLGVGEQSPLEVLKEVTAGIPMEVRIDVTELVIDGNKVRIEAQTDSYDSVDRIRGGLLKAGRYQEVSVSDAKISADQARVSFRVQLTLGERGKGDRKSS
ncbi:MAG: pilus assembly protein PilM [Nitrospirae bacterium]|nr:pilus assembly protein PilM [Candidatus Manganitrophaceae bacterium]